MSRMWVLAGMAGMWAACAGPALAGTNLLVNGDFENETLNGATVNQSYQVNNDQSSAFTGAHITGWGNTGYTFLFTPGTASSTGAPSPENGGASLALWGPQGGTSSPNYSNNGMTATSPTGGNFLAEDGAYQQGFIYQTLTGLTVGQTYYLSFWWAAAQQSGFTGQTTENWTAYWADANLNLTGYYTTQTVTTPSEGFTPWTQAVTSFVATTTTETLGFMAAGTPNGTPPFSLLDGVSLQAAPEPADLGVFAVGLLGLAGGGLVRRRGKRAA